MVQTESVDVEGLHRELGKSGSQLGRGKENTEGEGKPRRLTALIFAGRLSKNEADRCPGAGGDRFCSPPIVDHIFRNFLNIISISQ